MDKAFWIILVAGAVTLAIRFAPFVFFGRGRSIPPAVRFLGSVLPPAIISIIILMTLRNIDLFEGSRGLPEFAGIAFTALLHLWKRNTLLSIAAGTALYMVLIRVI